ncbi:MAG: hypothetical protein DRP06_01100 [Candidatus Aenigmatarchaeota archaeon]|nr:MAG: hypothetical protein DRP06_01100 [Candidatus Aenigmarchaeota archaeon]
MDLQKIAKRIINENLSVKEKEMVVISAGPKSLKFAEMLAYESSMIGAQPAIMYGSSEHILKTYKNINSKFLRNIPELSKIISRNSDVEIHIDESNPFLDRQLPQNKLEIRRKTVKPLRDFVEKRILKKTIKSVLMGFPTEEEAKALGINFNKLNRIFWNTLDVDYNELYKFNKKLSKHFKNADKIRITGKNTDLKLSVKGRPALNSCGLWEKEKGGFFNLPDGELFFAPVENSANGEIYFDLPTLWHYGKQVEGVWFKFKNGKVVEYQIDKGKEAFEDIISNASGNKLNIAELGIGTNPRARPTGGLTIVDEKVMGTIHLAIGNNIGFGGKSDATIHWDFFKEMRNKSLLEVDGKPVMVNGKFVD